VAETLDLSAKLGTTTAKPRKREPGAPPIYERRRPELSTLHQVVRENLNTLYAAVEDGCASTPLPEFVRREFEQYLSLHAATTVRADDVQGREALVRYALRPPLAQKRLHLLPDGLVRIELKRPFRDGTVAVDLTLAVAPLPVGCVGAFSSLPPGALRGGSRGGVEVEGSGRAATTAAAAGAGFERSSDPAPPRLIAHSIDPGRSCSVEPSRLTWVSCSERRHRTSRGLLDHAALGGAGDAAVRRNSSAWSANPAAGAGRLLGTPLLDRQAALSPWPNCPQQHCVARFAHPLARLFHLRVNATRGVPWTDAGRAVLRPR